MDVFMVQINYNDLFEKKLSDNIKCFKTRVDANNYAKLIKTSMKTVLDNYVLPDYDYTGMGLALGDPDNDKLYYDYINDLVSKYPELNYPVIDTNENGNPFILWKYSSIKVVKYKLY